MKYTDLYFVKAVCDTLFLLSYWCVFRWIFFNRFQNYVLQYAINFKTDTLINQIEQLHSVKINKMVNDYVKTLPPLHNAVKYQTLTSIKIDVITTNYVLSDAILPTNPVYGYYQACGVYDDIKLQACETNIKQIFECYQTYGMYDRRISNNPLI